MTKKSREQYNLLKIVRWKIALDIFPAGLHISFSISVSDALCCNWVGTTFVTAWGSCLVSVRLTHFWPSLCVRWNQSCKDHSWMQRLKGAVVNVGQKSQQPHAHLFESQRSMGGSVQTENMSVCVPPLFCPSVLSGAWNCLSSEERNGKDPSKVLLFLISVTECCLFMCLFLCSVTANQDCVTGPDKVLEILVFLPFQLPVYSNI